MDTPDDISTLPDEEEEILLDSYRREPICTVQTETYYPCEISTDIRIRRHYTANDRIFMRAHRIYVPPIRRERDWGMSLPWTQYEQA